MGKGSEKIARELLSLEPTAIVELFTIYPGYEDRADFFINVHNGSLFGEGLKWQGETYVPIPMEIDGFEADAAASLSRPKLRISNKDLYVSDLLAKNEDFINARIFRKRTFVKFLDDENFDGGNPFGEQDPTAELTNQVYVVSQKTQENKNFVELELTTPLDLENSDVNSRRILARYCYWDYRGNGCHYQGRPIQKDDGSEFVSEFQTPIVTGTDTTAIGAIDYTSIEQNLPPLWRYQNEVDEFSFKDPNQQWDVKKPYGNGSYVWIENPKVMIHDPEGSRAPEASVTYYVAQSGFTEINRPGTNDPWPVASGFYISGQDPRTNPDLWGKDGCNKKLSSCKIRFGDENLPFGGFPGTDGFQFRSSI